MNIKHTLQQWLEVKEPKEPKDWSNDFATMEKELWKWKQVMRKKITTNCSRCTTPINLWPFENEAYVTEHDGEQYHKRCTDKPLLVKKKTK